jgi:hypothetical protein
MTKTAGPGSDTDPNPDPLVRTEAWIRGSGSSPKYHGSGTLLQRNAHPSVERRFQYNTGRFSKNNYGVVDCGLV